MSKLVHYATEYPPCHGSQTHSINEIQRQHSPELRSFAVNEINLTGYTDEHNMLQAMITLKRRQGVEIGLDQITGLTLVFYWELYIEHRFRPRVQVVSSEQQNWGHILWSQGRRPDIRM